MARVHVWLLNMGGPDSLTAVRPFLQRLLGDPLVVPLPFRWLQALFAFFISMLRARKVRGAYEKMGGASPQLAMVDAQARLLNRSLGERYLCRPVLRYWGPGATDAAAQVQKGERVVLLSLYPHACQATTRSSMEDALAAVQSRGGAIAEVIRIDSYPTDPAYVEAVVETLREAIIALPVGQDYEVLFSAHGVPLSFIDRGDPYLAEIQATVAAVVRASRLRVSHQLSFQSKVGPAKWLEPSTDEALRRMGDRGLKAVVVVPIAFTSEHIETVIELDEELAEVARQVGIQHYQRAATVGTRPTFIRALAEMVRRAERDNGWPRPEDRVNQDLLEMGLRPLL
jgi:ferrochelatase